MTALFGERGLLPHAPTGDRDRFTARWEYRTLPGVGTTCRRKPRRLPPPRYGTSFTPCS